MWLTWRILTRQWDDYAQPPAGVPRELWAPLVKRFSVTDLATPVLQTLVSSVYGGPIRRQVRRAYAIDDAALVPLKSFMPRFFSEAAAYGTAVAVLDSSGALRLLPSVRVSLVTDMSDASRVKAVELLPPAGLGGPTIVFAEDGAEYVKTDSGMRLVKNGAGYPRFVVGRGRWVDAGSPYGESLIWPAVQETVQVTYLMNDLMVLERAQSFSTLVLTGQTMKDRSDMAHGPFAIIRFDGSNPQADAKFISPDAKIDQINHLIEAKFQRCAAQCSVPVELFTGPRSGANVSAGAAFLTHRPLYDLTLLLQEEWAQVERDMAALLDAAAVELRGEQNISMEAVKSNLDFVVEYERDSNPSFTQSEAQMWTMLLDAGVVPFAKVYRRYNPEATPDEVQAAEERYRKERQINFDMEG
jgi:hypothetical protein